MTDLADATPTTVPNGATAPATADLANGPADPGLAEIRRQVMWNRLIAIVEEQAQTLVRTAFSTSTREAGDLSAGVFDTRGRMLAQSVTGTPGHVNSMAYSVLHFLEEFPIETMRPGDIFLTNDPWRGTGHLYDIVVVTPTFHRGRAVALFACTSHVVDIGGIGFSTEGREIYHEGLFLPLVPLARAGVFDETLLRIVRANVREPVQVEGDIFSLAACNDTGSRRLVQMMDEFDVDDLDALADHVIERSRQAMLAEIAQLRPGVYRNSMRVESVEGPVDLVAALEVSAAGLRVDFAGTSPASSYGMNVPMAYTDAYTSFGVRCIVGPHIPNNTGSLEVVEVAAPQGSILNAPHPHAVNVRHIIGQMLPDVVMGCLAQIVPERVPAEGTSALWNIHASGSTERGDNYIVLSFHSGGAGARPAKDGLSATAFPSGVKNMPVEVNEAISPLVFWRKEYRPDSGGPGRHRGGLGQTIELGNTEDRPFTISASYERVEFPARGRAGGAAGATGALRLDDGTPVAALGRTVVPAGRRVVYDFPGGGGLGDPAERDPARLAADVEAGLVSPGAAERDYGRRAGPEIQGVSS